MCLIAGSPYTNNKYKITSRAISAMTKVIGPFELFVGGVDVGGGLFMIVAIFTHPL